MAHRTHPLCNNIAHENNKRSSMYAAERLYFHVVTLISADFLTTGYRWQYRLRNKVIRNSSKAKLQHITQYGTIVYIHRDGLGGLALRV